MRTGNVTIRGVARNTEIVTLSKDVMNANSAPAVIPGVISGRVTANARSGGAPRLRAARSTIGSSPVRLATTRRMA